MKILIVGPLKRRVAKNITAARPRLVFDLASGLVAKGHRVSILGTGNSKVAGAKIIPVIPKSVIELEPFENEFVARTSFLAKQAKIVEKIGNQFDIIHNHSRPEFFNLFAAENLKTPMLTTLHGVMDELTDEIFSLFKKTYIVCISQSASKAAKKTKVHKIVYNGVDTNLYKFNPKKQGYLLWVGRLARAKNKAGQFLDTKGVRWAIELARATNSKLKLVASIEDMKFFNKDVKPYLSKTIQWVAPLSKEQPLSKKQIADLMGKAKAFLMTVNWQEPFGLVMAEAMSCGTPVIGFDRGSVKELIKNNKTGFVVPPNQGLFGLKKALAKIDKIKPADCRKHIEQNFSLKKMVDNYEKTYFSLIKKYGKTN